MGSSDYPCAQDFRGPFAFSEPETRAMRDFIEESKDSLKMAFNFHAYGNLFLHPVSSDWMFNLRLEFYYPEQAEIYREIWEEAGFPEGSK